MLSCTTITPLEMANLLGKKNPESIKIALRNGTFPIGFAYKANKQWVYVVPREAFMNFVKTGKVEVV